MIQSQIDIKFLSKELGVSGYRLTGMVRAAKKNESIVEALIEAGYDILMIPDWFALSDLLRKEKSERRKRLKKTKAKKVNAVLIETERNIPDNRQINSLPVGTFIPQQSFTYQPYHIHQEGYEDPPREEYVSPEMRLLMQAIIDEGNQRLRQYLIENKYRGEPFDIALLRSPPLVELLIERQEELKEIWCKSEFTIIIHENSPGFL